MFDLSLLKAVLTKEQQAFGLSVEEDEDALFLMFEGKAVAKFSSYGANYEAIREEADKFINHAISVKEDEDILRLEADYLIDQAKSGVEFVKENRK